MFLYRANGHPQGESDVPQYEIRGQFVYPVGPTTNASNQPWFVINSGQLFATQFHPLRRGTLPWFTICDNALVQAAGHPAPQTRTAWFTTRAGPIQAAMTTGYAPIFTDWPGLGYQTAAATVRNLFRGEPVTTRSVASALCTGEDTVQHDLRRAERMGLVTRLPYGEWLPVVR